MSHKAIRDAARAMVIDAGWPAGLPFFETLNEEPDDTTLPDLWCTLSFEAQSDDRIAIGSVPVTQLEEGTVRVKILARSGLGDAAAVDARESVRGFPYTFTGWPAGLTIDKTRGPTDPFGGGDGSWFRADLAIDYSYQHTSP